MQKTLKLVFAFILSAAVCTGIARAENPSTEKGKAAIIYFSQTGNTRLACETVAKEIPSALIELKETQPPVVDIGPYSFVVLASPVWAANLVPAVQDFLKNNPLGGRKVVVLTTTNLSMPDEFQEKHKKLVVDAGGVVAGYYQIIVMEKKDAKGVPRKKEDIQKDTIAIAAEIRKKMQ